MTTGRPAGGGDEKMEEQRKSLHVNRLRKALDEIPDLANENAHSSRFKGWQRRVDTSLKELFPLDHNYVFGFGCLHFWHERVQVEQDEWDEADQEQYEKDLEQARQIIADALEEYENAPPAAPALPPVEKPAQPTIQINVHTTLAQVTTISLAQVIGSIDQLGLSQEQQEEAHKLAQQFEAQAKAQKPWSVLGKTIEGFKKLGKDAYEKIAIPLILAYLKQQTGVGDL